MLLPKCSILIPVQIPLSFRLSKVEQENSPNTCTHTYRNKPCVGRRKTMWPFQSMPPPSPLALALLSCRDQGRAGWHRKYSVVSEKAWYYRVQLELPFQPRFHSLGSFSKRWRMLLQSPKHGITKSRIWYTSCFSHQS